MKILISFLFILLLSCSNKKQELTKIQAFCIVGRGETLELEKKQFMDIDKINIMITRINNEFFETEFKNQTFIHHKLKIDHRILKEVKDSFDNNSKENINKQKENLRKSDVGCDLGFGYFLDDSNTKNFCLLQSRELKNRLIFTRNKKEKVRDKYIEIKLEETYYKINSKRWDYYMSNEYVYKDLRTYRFVEFKK
jgi:hypothetical protein